MEAFFNSEDKEFEIAGRLESRQVWINQDTIKSELPYFFFLQFIYVNQSFAPSPDQEVGTLYECFGSDGKLVLHYCKSQAWG